MSNPEDVMFSPAVKAEQTRLGSRRPFEDRDWKTEITDDLRQFLGVIDTFFFATASADGRPYIQHRGGPPGFLKTDRHAIRWPSPTSPATGSTSRSVISRRTTAPTSSSCTSPPSSA